MDKICFDKKGTSKEKAFVHLYLILLEYKFGQLTLMGLENKKL